LEIYTVVRLVPTPVKTGIAAKFVLVFWCQGIQEADTWLS